LSLTVRLPLLLRLLLRRRSRAAARNLIEKIERIAAAAQINRQPEQQRADAAAAECETSAAHSAHIFDIRAFSSS
jgi:hypothetical protein